MKSLKSILLSTLGFFAVATTAISFTSCEQDSCKVLTCVNGGRCDNGLCECPDGFSGAECEIVATDQYVGMYLGNTRCTYDGVLFPIINDTVYINEIAKPYDINLVIRAGNTSLGTFLGKIQDNNTLVFDPIESRDNSGKLISRINSFVKLDGDLMDILLITENYLPDGTMKKQSCSFIGKKHRELEF